jgi:hypothetical protein
VLISTRRSIPMRIRQSATRSQAGEANGVDLSVAPPQWTSQARHTFVAQQETFGWLPKPATRLFPRKRRSLRELWSRIVVCGQIRTLSEFLSPCSARTYWREVFTSGCAAASLGGMRRIADCIALRPRVTGERAFGKHSRRCGEMADAQDLKSWDCKKSCEFESHHRHHFIKCL